MSHTVRLQVDGDDINSLIRIYSDLEHEKYTLLSLVGAITSHELKIKIETLHHEIAAIRTSSPASVLSSHRKSLPNHHHNSAERNTLRDSEHSDPSFVSPQSTQKASSHHSARRSLVNQSQETPQVKDSDAPGNQVLSDNGVNLQVSVPYLSPRNSSGQQLSELSPTSVFNESPFSLLPKSSRNSMNSRPSSARERSGQKPIESDTLTQTTSDSDMTPAVVAHHSSGSRSRSHTPPRLASPEGTLRRKLHTHRLPTSMLHESNNFSSVNIDKAAFFSSHQRALLNNSETSGGSISSSPSSSSLDSMNDPLSTVEGPPPPLECTIIDADFSSLVDGVIPAPTSSLMSSLVSWSFPKKKSSLSVQGISSFCFPSGVSTQFLHRAKAATFINKQTDERHILQFTDSNGLATYACVVITQVAFVSPSLQVTRALSDISRRINASNTLKSYLRRIIVEKKRERWNSGRYSHGSFSALSNRPDVASIQTEKRGFFSRMLSLGSSKKDTIPHSSSSSMLSNMAQPPPSPSRTSSAGGRVTSASPGRYPSSTPEKQSTQSSKPSPNLNKLPEEYVQLNHSSHVIVSRRAYCIITHEPMHSKVFQILQAMADGERSSSLDVVTRREQLAPPQRTIEKSRKVFLETISAHIAQTSTHQSKHRKKALSKPVPTARVSVPGYVDLVLYNDPNYYPSLKEWSAAVLLTYLAPRAIIKLINLLLIEKSVIVYSKQARPGVVTAVCIALKSLIAPFAWEGAFFPLIPDDVHELFDAPVPFIAGTIAQPNMNGSSSIAVLVLDEVSMPANTSPTNSLPITAPSPRQSRSLPTYQTIDAKTQLTVEYMAWFLHLPELSVEMPQVDGLEQTIYDLRSRLLASVEANRTVNQISPDVYFTSSMSAAERETVAAFIEAIHGNNFDVCGDVNTPARWKKYIKVNYVTGELSFQPHLFIEPLRTRMEWVDAVANTQHFMSYVEQQQVEYLAQEHRLRVFLGDWLAFQWPKRKNRSSVQ